MPCGTFSTTWRRLPRRLAGARHRAAHVKMQVRLISKTKTNDFGETTNLQIGPQSDTCLLYTSDAADDM
eukprot:12350474-Alexandrium_andersonii.AAC.1